MAAPDFATLARQAVAKAAGLGGTDELAARLEALKAAVAAPVPAPCGGGGKGPTLPPAGPAPFDFTPAGGVPFDFAPGALSPGGGRSATRAFDFVDLRPAAALPTAGRAAAAEPLAAGAVPAAAAADPGLAAAAEAGPLLALTAAAELTAAGFRAARAGVAELGGAARAVAGNDGVGLVTRAAGLAADGLDHLPVVGKAVGEGFRLAAAGAKEFDQTARAFVARGRELAQYDGRLAAAAAMADVRAVTADIREARRTSEAMARVIDSQSRFEESIQDAMAPLKKLFADRIADILEKVTPAIDLAARGIEEGVALLPEAVTVGRALTVTLAALSPAAKLALVLFEKKAEQAAKEERQKDEEEILGQFFRATDALGLRAADPRAPLVERQQDQLGIPLLSR